MMWSYGPNMGWMWLWGVLLLVGIGLLVLVAVRLFAGGGSHGGMSAPPGPYPGRSRALQILDERFARGELTAEQYREQLKVLGGDQ
ncbi:SHOCT domain-containing protein [Arthrobacter oryzae]|uniref:SHOCT domain-containing protein n=1 Tax=Arthrobacter oryzae TaxID=409290 RepID=A0A3N0C2B9_9MICC|nr:SHOCT domain-containing protein [Arthrobacter oryzae]RNL55985.1 SHOCT domain-containing protein [Arthrobacter oryzae]